MTFSELTWSPDNWNEELELHVGWQAQYQAPNGYLLVVNAQLNLDGSPLASAYSNGQLYSCSVYSWNRTDEGTDVMSTEHECGDDRVDAIIQEVEALTLPE